MNTVIKGGPGGSVGIATELPSGGSGIESRLVFSNVQLRRRLQVLLSVSSPSCAHTMVTETALGQGSPRLLVACIVRVIHEYRLPLYS